MNSILADVKPVVWVKWKNREPNANPLARSGHTITLFNGKFVLFGGTVNGLDDPNIKKVGPANDMWILDIYQKNTYGWSKLSPKGEVPPPKSHRNNSKKKRKR